MDTLIHLPLEPYKQRYTEYLQGVETEAFSKVFNVEAITPADPAVLLDVNSGSVLDSTGRPLWALQQVSQLIQRPGARDLGRVYCSDFYTPGLDAIAYSKRKAHLSAFLWAQTFDTYDFTTEFINWMRPWEIMAFEIYEQVFVASSLLKDLICTALPGAESKVFVVGLPFNSKQVAKLFDPTSIPADTIDCVYSSRWDIEKNPNVFLDVVERCPDLTFAICTGWSEVRGTDRNAINRLKQGIDRGLYPNLTVFNGLTKAKYFSILTKCKVQFNCAYQDWVSFTLLEALTFGCVPLYPNFRSFPEALNYEHANLYRPGDADDAAARLISLARNPVFDSRESVLNWHDGTMGRIANLIR